MEKINYKKLRKAFNNLPKDYAKLVREKIPDVSNSRIHNIRALVYSVDEETYSPGSKTINVFIELLRISEEYKKNIDLLK
jgi:DNA-binding response OmpR family regulator|tara:strand:+ start:262 stop:501 length:240 start_codon:yes stop_codon:yes gene_type:complete